MATSNFATSILRADFSLATIGKSHTFKTWDASLPNGTGLDTALNSYANTKLVVLNTGSIGIGTIAPRNALDVSTGTVKCTYLVGDGSQLTGISAPSSAFWRYDNNSNIYLLSGNVGINTATPLALLDVYNSNNRLTPFISVEDETTKFFNIQGNGNIGIGTRGTTIDNQNAFVIMNNPQTNVSYMRVAEKLRLFPNSSTYSIGIGTVPTTSNAIHVNGTVNAVTDYFVKGPTILSFNDVTNITCVGGATPYIHFPGPGTGMRVSRLYTNICGTATTNGLTVTGDTYIETGNVGIATTPITPLHVFGRTLFAGNVGIGTTNLDSDFKYMLQLADDSAAKPATSTWATTSDIRLKEDIVTANYGTCFAAVSNLDLRYYKWRDDVPGVKDIRDRHKLGWIANEVQQVFPKAVCNIGNMYGLPNVLDLNVDQIYAAMYGAIKTLIEGADDIDARMRAVGV